MELDDLKKTWDLINDRMKQKEKMAFVLTLKNLKILFYYMG